jgi:hypothetical protein
MEKLVILKGITKKGKERINQHGSFWKETEMTTVSGAKKLYESTSTAYLKWGPEPDFEIVG